MAQLPITPLAESQPTAAPSLPSTPMQAQPESLSAPPTEAPPAIFEGLPEEIQKLPVIQWISVGSPPAVRFGPQEYFPELRPLVTHAPDLIENGLGLFQAQTRDTVLFNPLFIGLQELQAADQAGKLQEIVPDYATLAGQTPSVPSPEDAAALQREQEQAGRQLQDMLATPKAAATPPMSRPTSAPATEQRLRGLVPEGPASGPAPGRGRILNALLTPAK